MPYPDSVDVYPTNDGDDAAIDNAATQSLSKFVTLSNLCMPRGRLSRMSFIYIFLVFVLALV